MLAATTTQDMGNATKLKSVMQKVCVFIAPPGEDGVLETLQRATAVPSQPTMSRTLLRVEVLLATAERHRFLAQAAMQADWWCSRWCTLCADATDVCGHEYFVAEEDCLSASSVDALLGPAGPAKAASIKRTCFVPVTLGSGRTDLPHKLQALLHQVRIHRSASSYQQRNYFCHVIGFLSDMGVEHNLSSAPLPDLEAARLEAISDSGGMCQSGTTGMTIDGNRLVDPAIGVEAAVLENPDSSAHVAEDRSPYIDHFYPTLGALQGTATQCKKDVWAPCRHHTVGNSDKNTSWRTRCNRCSSLWMMRP